MVYCVLIKLFESLLKTYNYSVMWQFGTSAFNTVVHWCELGEVENECTSYNFRNLPSLCQKLSDLVEVWCSYNKNNFACFFLRHGIDHSATKHCLSTKSSHIFSFLFYKILEDTYQTTRRTSEKLRAWFSLLHFTSSSKNLATGDFGDDWHYLQMTS